MSWSVRLHDEFEPEFGQLPESVQDEILALMALLREYGPKLGRPHADTLNGSKHANMKELRFEFGVRYWFVDQWKGYVTIDKHLKATTHMVD